MTVVLEVIGPGGDVIDQVDLAEGVAVRLLHSTVRLVPTGDAAPAAPAETAVAPPAARKSRPPAKPKR
jgi:hypothetical protein